MKSINRTNVENADDIPDLIFSLWNKKFKAQRVGNLVRFYVEQVQYHYYINVGRLYRQFLMPIQEEGVSLYWEEIKYNSIEWKDVNSTYKEMMGNELCMES